MGTVGSLLGLHDGQLTDHRVLIDHHRVDAIVGELLRAFTARCDGRLLLLPVGRLLGSHRGAFLSLLLGDLLAGPLLVVMATLRHTHPRVAPHHAE